MATILTVHGTNNSGPKEGVSWWQVGGIFEQDVQRYVESEDGVLEFHPLIWDGRNSEISRRTAGQELADTMERAETANQRYCIVGHSHGGSVIWHGALASVLRKNKLASLSKIISIGTPFLTSKPQGLLFSRMSIVSRIIYVTLFTVSLVFVVTFVSALLFANGVTTAWWTFPVVFFPIAALHATFWAYERHRLK